MADRFRPKEICAKLDELLACIPTDEHVQPLRGTRLADFQAKVSSAIRALDGLSKAVDPIRQPERMFDPSDPQVVGKLIAFTLLAQPRFPLYNLERFYGSGVYAIYSNSDFPAYQQIKGLDHPIYIGKADPAVHAAQTAVEQQPRLHRRLNDHVRTIEVADNLEVADFECRYLVVKSAWQTTAEDYLISIFRPVWNNETNVCYGFGKHGDKADTRGNTRSPWDVLHPGRAWAQANEPGKSAEQIVQDIARHFAEHPPMSRPQFDRLVFD